MADDQSVLDSPKGINIAHLNVASILGPHKFEMMRQQIETSNLHVFCASETWLKESIPNGLIQVKGFQVARQDRGWADEGMIMGTKRGGGLICYVRDNLTLNEFKYAHLNQSTKDLEMQWVLLEMKNMRNIVIVNVYRPPQGNYKNGCKSIHNAIKEANLKDNVEIFLLGDFNINLKDRASPMARELESTTSLWGLKALIKENTRLGLADGSLKGTCIDNIFTNSEYIMAAGVLDWNFSDHLVIAAKRKRDQMRAEKVVFEGRSYKNYVKEDLQNELLESDWGQFYEIREPNLCWDIIEDRIRAHLERTCPKKEFRVKEVREPWVTNEILEEIKDKDAAMRVARRSGLPQDWVHAKAERNRVGRLIEQAKAEFLKEQQQELVDDPKKFWRLVKSIVPGKRKSTGKISLVKKSMINGAEVEEEVEGPDTADFINDFFSNIGPKLAKNYSDPWEFYGEELGEECPPLSTDFEQVMQLCRDIKICKSSGFGDIPTKVFKDAFRVIIPQLVFLFNLSFSNGSFPSRWKRATIIPLYKGGDKTEVSNYRPVPLLPLPGKLIEKIAHNKLVKFLNEHNVISDKQAGFRSGFSTSRSIADLTDDLFTNINEGLTSLAVFVDLRKAFDTVNHDILLSKINLYGIRNGNLQWCRNYLSDRSQVTLANGKLSNNSNIVCGVPQGSVLGPLFFILYINDVQNAVNGANVQLYADDTVIYASGPTAEETARKLQPTLNLFSKWCRINKLSLNTSKTKQMAFGTRHKVKKAKRVVLLVNDVPLQMVPTYKYLGFMLDSTLSFNYHVKSVANTVTYKAVLLGKIRKFLTEEVALQIYKSMILPYLDYGDVIFANAGQEGLLKLQRLQNRCLKICKGYNVRFETDELHYMTKVPKLDVRREAHVNNFMYNRLSMAHLVDERDIRTRAHDAPMFIVDFPNLMAFKRAVKYAGSLQWNKLPSDIRNLASLDAFKQKQKDLMLQSVQRP